MGSVVFKTRKDESGEESGEESQKKETWRSVSPGVVSSLQSYVIVEGEEPGIGSRGFPCLDAIRTYGLQLTEKRQEECLYGRDWLCYIYSICSFYSNPWRYRNISLSIGADSCIEHDVTSCIGMLSHV